MEDIDKKQISSRQRNCLLHECCFWVYHLVVVALGFVIFSKIFISFTISQEVQRSDQLMHAKQTVNLWKKGYIIDIKSVNTNNCPEGYSPLLSYTWTGSMQGCYCEATVSNYKGKCTSELSNEGCKQINAMDPQNLHMWKGGKLICQKRAQSLNFYDSINEKTTDGVTLKKCSQNKRYHVNVLPNISCPITQVSNKSLSASSTVLLLDSVSGQKLSYISQSGFPNADFKITEYDFCKFLSEINISPNKVGNYKLQDIKYQPCSGRDTRYVEFDVMNEEDFYTNNTRVYDKLVQLPGYPRPSTNYVFKLGYIRYPEWSYSCRVSHTHNLNSATEHLLFTKQQNIMKILLTVSVPCIAVFALLFRIFFTIRHIIILRTKMMYNAVFLTDDEIIEQLPNLNVRKSKPREIFIFVIEQLPRIAVIVVVLISLLNLMNTSVWIKMTFVQSCTQTYVNNLFRFYEQKVDQINQILVEVCFIWTVMWIVDIIWFILRFKYMDLTQKCQQEKLQTQSVPSQQNDPINQQKLKELQLPEDSSEVILEKNRPVKILDVDDLMGDDVLYGAGETKGNFYGEIQNSDYKLVAAKKKKKKIVRKNKNLFKDDK